MYKWGKESLKKINTLDHRLQIVLDRFMSYQLIDATIIFGGRSKVQQFSLFQKGRENVGMRLENPRKKDIFLSHMPEEWMDGWWVPIAGNETVTNLDGYIHKSDHNYKPSRAFDIAPWINGKISYKQEHVLPMAGMILAAAKELNIPMKWGGNWDKDGEPITDQVFDDLLHFAIKD